MAFGTYDNSLDNSVERRVLRDMLMRGVSKARIELLNNYSTVSFHSEGYVLLIERVRKREYDLTLRRDGEPLCTAHGHMVDKDIMFLS